MIINKYCKYLKCPVAPNIKEMQFKNLNDIYPAAETLRKKIHFEIDPCVICLKEPETINHLFFLCSVTFQFWQDLYSCLNSGTDNSFFEPFQILIYMDNPRSQTWSA